jgi:NTP pyrophosphatase (non-canonical NTP hydrolase)
MKDMNILTRLISQWHADRKITINGNAATQFLKLVEETGELAHAHLRDDKEGVADAIGDIYVVLVALAELEGTDIVTCVEGAWEEIKGRKGYLNAQGNFIKEEDT